MEPHRRDSIRSTWQTGDKTAWTVHHRLIDSLNILPRTTDAPPPAHPKTDKIPFCSQRTQQRWILFHAFVPLLLHQALVSLPVTLPYEHTPLFHKLSKIGAFLLYFNAFNITVIREAKMIRNSGLQHGFLDGDEHERDGVPDVGVAKVGAALFKTTGSRLIVAIVLTYIPGETPFMAMSRPSWWAWLALEIGLYGIILDFWFYWYHRAMHDIDGLWKFHRTHHLTKHPNALLSAYADHEQEFFDMVGVPFMTYVTMKTLGLPLGFYEWWICHQYIAFTEVAGHSGLRIHVMAPSTLAWFLELFNAEIMIEDHDLHHRKGYRKTHNYGKQTRLWDRIFGTCGERIECGGDNVDYENEVHMPIFFRG